MNEPLHFKNKKILIFDFDGVLIDSVGIKTWAFGEIYHQYGNDIKKKVIQYQKTHGGIDRIRKFTYFHKNYLNIFLSEMELNHLSNKFSELVLSKLKKTPLTYEVIPFLSDLKIRGIPLYCVSASPYKELIDVMQHKSLTKYFAGIYGGGVSKEDNFEKIHIETKTRYKNMVYIGDSKSDLISSRKKNIDFIGYGSTIPSWGENELWINNWHEYSNVVME